MLLVMVLHGPLYVPVNRFLCVPQCILRVQELSNATGGRRGSWGGGKEEGDNRKRTWFRNPPVLIYNRQKASKNPYV